MDNKQIVDEVRDQYAAVAKSGLTNESAAIRSVAAAFGYSEEELQQLPHEANMGLSCGNPLALAGVMPGEVVLDLGCGGGMDVFLAAQRVGPTGKAIGVDMTSEMLERARAAQQRMGVTNVEFHQATIDQLPIADQSVDVIISNCVINLVPDKLAVMREIWRVLKPGGRVAISDIALRQTLPENIKESMEAYVGCISGAVMIDEYRELLLQAGFGLVTVTDSGADLNAYALVGGGGCCGGICGSPSMAGEGSSVHDGITSIMQTFDANAYAASVKVHAIKGATQSSAPSASNGSQLPVANFHSSLTQEKKMKTFQIYDKPMCCSTGVCGPEVDPVLPRFAADLDWLKQQGYQVDRFNLAQQPTAFIENKVIHQLLGTAGTDCLPVIVVDGQIVSQKAYPSRDQLAAWALGKPSGSTLPVSSSTGGCCGSSGCC